VSQPTPVRRTLVVVGAIVCGIASLALAFGLATVLVPRFLPTGSRATVYRGSVEERANVGRHWYSEQDAAALSAELAAAVEGTDWCLGWSIVIDDDGVGADRADVGSSRSTTQPARSCGQYVEVAVTYAYTGSTSEQEDNAAFDVLSSDPEVTEAFLEHPAYQVSASDLLHEDRGTSRDDVIGNAIAGLPLVLAETGRLDPLTVQPVGEETEGTEATEGAVEFADREGEGGSDLWRAHRLWLLGGGLAVALGLTIVLMAWAQFPANWFGLPPVTARGPDGRPVNPRRALKAALQPDPAPTRTSPRLRRDRNNPSARPEEEQGAPG
jgi:hypothetical protein